MFVEEKAGRSAEPRRDAPAGLTLCHISNDPCQTGGQQQNPGPTIRKRGGRRDTKLENSCVGGSIPPRATKNIVYETPTHASGRCRFWVSQSSCPVHVRYGYDQATRGRSELVRSSALKGFASTSVPARRRPKTHIFTARIFFAGD